MECRYENKVPSHGKFVATLGLSFGEFEGLSISDYPMETGFYTKGETKDNGLDVLEVREVGNKYKAFQEFAQMLARWGYVIEDAVKMPHTHEERCDIAKSFLNRVRLLPAVSSAEVIGSLKRGDDSAISDIDIKILADSCPGEDKCDIVRLVKGYAMEPLDIFCNPQKPVNSE
jgi:hypothetical protein